MIGLTLTRTCKLADFPECSSAAMWQQYLTVHAYTQWAALRSTAPLLTGVHALVNMSGVDHVLPIPFRDAACTYHSARDFQDDRAIGRSPGRPLASVVALSVIDRIDAPFTFLRAVNGLLVPGGLLVLTFAYWDAEGSDIADGHELRRRIYTRDKWQDLLLGCKTIGLHAFGGIDWSYHGHTLRDHTLASLTLTKGSFV